MALLLRNTDLAPFSQKSLVPHQICALCGRGALQNNPSATTGVRHLERLIDDLLRMITAGLRMAAGRSLSDLLGSACFQFSKQRMSIARLPHPEIAIISFRQLTEGRSTPFGNAKKSREISYWKTRRSG